MSVQSLQWESAAPGADGVVRQDLVFRPHLHQWDALQATLTHDVVWSCGGKGAGKTWLLAHWLYIMATRYMPGHDALLIEPNYDTFHDVFLRTWRRAIPGEGIAWDYRTTKGTQGNSRQIVIYSSGPDGERLESTIFVRSANDARAIRRTEGLTTIAFGAMDEPSEMLAGKEAFDNLVGRARVPNSMGHNPILIVGKPEGFNWLAKAFGCTTDHPDHGYTHGYHPDPAKRPRYFVRACRTTDNAEHLAPNYAERMRTAYGERFYQQECNAALVRAQGQIFPGWHAAVHVIPHKLMVELWRNKIERGGGRALAAMDWGFTNPAAVLVAGLTGDSELLVPDLWYERGKQVEHQGLVWHRFNARWGLGGGCVADPSEPQNIEKLVRGFHPPGHPAGAPPLSVPCRRANNAWQYGIDVVRNLMHLRRGLDHPVHGSGMGCPRLLISDRCQALIDELDGYRQKKERQGRPASEGADGEDHAIDCLRYAAAELVHTPTLEGVAADY